MAFIIFFFLKKFEKVEKTGIIATKLSVRCTPSVILGDFLNGSLLDKEEEIDPPDMNCVPPALPLWSCCCSCARWY